MRNEKKWIYKVIDEDLTLDALENTLNYYGRLGYLAGFIKESRSFPNRDQSHYRIIFRAKRKKVRKVSWSDLSKKTKVSKAEKNAMHHLMQ